MAIRIALDAMGTDHAPRAEVGGAVQALSELESDIEVILVGDQPVIEAELAKLDSVPDRLTIRHAPERVTSEDSPGRVIRRKPESSIVIGLQMHLEGEADAFVSAGPTGAVMAASLLTLRPIPGVDRPPVGTILPTAKDYCLLLDAGANIDCKPSHLVQFAHLGSVYARDAMGIEEPRVALLNIGEEPGKGDERTLATHELLAADEGINFVGNIEGRDIIHGACDVIVCDGFVGNILLKFYESVAGFLLDVLDRRLGAEGRSQFDLDNVFRVLDYAEYGGAPLLGIGGVSIICHGESTPKAIRNALAVAVRSVRSDLVRHIAEELSAPEETS